MEHADCAALHWNTYILFAYVLWGGVGKVLSFLKALSNIKLPMSLRTFHPFFSAVLGPPRGIVFSRCGVWAPQL